jgi:predicted nucleotidyltransferase
MYKIKFKIKNKYLSSLVNNIVSIMIINWIFQGLRIKSFHEILFFLFIELSLLIILFKFFNFSIYISFVISHSINWLFNGHFWVILRYSKLYKASMNSLKSQYQYIVNFIQRSWMIDEAIIIGSFAFEEGKINPNSDIDARLFFYKNKNFFKINFSLFILRSISLFKIIPLDICSISDLNKINLLSNKEKIIIIKDKNNRIERFLIENSIIYENYKH